MISKYNERKIKKNGITCDSKVLLDQICIFFNAGDNSLDIMDAINEISKLVKFDVKSILEIPNKIYHAMMVCSEDDKEKALIKFSYGNGIDFANEVTVIKDCITRQYEYECEKGFVEIQFEKKIKNIDFKLLNRLVGVEVNVNKTKFVINPSITQVTRFYDIVKVAICSAIELGILEEYQVKSFCEEIKKNM